MHTSSKDLPLNADALQSMQPPMHAATDCNRRILLVDDNSAIHEDFRKILGPVADAGSELEAHENALFGMTLPLAVRPEFELHSALQGEIAIELVRSSLQNRRRYAVAFIDARMPPGIDGIETIARIWELDPEIQIILCTAFSDHTWQQLARRLRRLDQLIILKKPFDNIEVLQLAESLAQKWRIAREEQRRVESLERNITERGRQLHAMELRNAQLDETNKQLAAATRLTVADGDGDPVGKSLRYRELAREMCDALDARQISVHYQPVVAVKNRRILSMEALVRWNHPQLGAVSPAEFIPIAEQTGLIGPIGQFVLRSACEQVMRWHRDGLPTVCIAVNISPVQLELQDLPEEVARILRETGAPVHKLALELTESTFVGRSAQHWQTLQKLRAMGVRVQMDDFGTGYSSLAHLRHLPVDTIKIDRAFIARLGADPIDEAIVGAIVEMARSMRLGVIAEGVETQLQLDVLARQGCEAAQGYFFSKPLPPEQCGSLLFELSERTSFTDTLRMRLSNVR